MSEVIVIDQRTAVIDRDTHQVVRVIDQGSERSYVPLKPFCDVLGASWSAAYERIQRDEVLSSVIREIRTTAADGKQYKTLCLPVEYVNGFIFGFSASQVRPELREKLIVYKHTCYQRLFEAFSGQPAPTSPALTNLAARIEALAAEVNQLKAGQSTQRQLPAQGEGGQARKKPGPKPGCRPNPPIRIEAIITIVQAADGPVTPTEVFNLLNGNAGPDQVRHRMRRLARAGLLRRIDRGYYTLPNDEARKN
jgi:hypothetical protein